MNWAHKIASQKQTKQLAETLLSKQSLMRSKPQLLGDGRALAELDMLRQKIRRNSATGDVLQDEIPVKILTQKMVRTRIG
jgi:hypothetical protein